MSSSGSSKTGGLDRRDQVSVEGTERGSRTETGLSYGGTVGGECLNLLRVSLFGNGGVARRVGGGIHCSCRVRLTV